MNNFKKIGVSALAGSLAMTAANAIEMSVSGSAAGALATSDENGKSFFYQYDSVVFSAAGETDGGIGWKVEMGVDSNVSDSAATEAVDGGSVSISGDFGTIRMGNVDNAATRVGLADGSPVKILEMMSLASSEIGT